ncbi:hypothetical protein NDI56_03825 [Haloarcula sp. S1CR25-12]|uniref:Uncharacterized protein n=1 Tax=Haloarcula saliterrae TaxID=2950534 RepID=A0ABU2F8G2_9EURY|nr:hypothetical protein [Haloarcula sp. S1CR25-12]MDS0258539.1 hypothetical protein [Haloarcula sp. S1CR25-12]
MPTLSVDEREERIAADDGDREDTVLQVINNGRQSCYHDPDADCAHLAQATETRERTRGWCHDHGFAPCKRCVLGTAVSGGQESLGTKLLNGDVGVDHDFAWDQDGGEA